MHSVTRLSAEKRYCKNNAENAHHSCDVRTLAMQALHSWVKFPGVKLQTLLLSSSRHHHYLSPLYSYLSVSYCPGLKFALRYEVFLSWLELISVNHKPKKKRSFRNERWLKIKWRFYFLDQAQTCVHPLCNALTDICHLRYLSSLAARGAPWPWLSFLKYN